MGRLYSVKESHGLRNFNRVIDCDELHPTSVERMCHRLGINFANGEIDFVWIAVLYCRFLLRFSVKADSLAEKRGAVLDEILMQIDSNSMKGDGNPETN